MIVFVHLFNDHSGAPKVLAQTIKAARECQLDAVLYVGSGSVGFLSDLPLPTRSYWYRRSENKLLTLVNYLLSQCALFLKLCADSDARKADTIFVNALMPFGAALFGKLMRKRVIIHVHEVSFSPPALGWFLRTIQRLTSNISLYVSDAHLQAMAAEGPGNVRVYNGLDESLQADGAAHDYHWKRQGRFTALMLASNRQYKGIQQFVELARSMASVKGAFFEMVLNASDDDVNQFVERINPPSNLKVFSRIRDPAPFYQRASVVLNLSLRDQCVETFGLTILEAMAFSIPVIVPPVGGPVELVCDGQEGFLVDAYDCDLLKRRVMELYASESLARVMSAKAQAKATLFSEETFRNNIAEILIDHTGEGASRKNQD